MPLLLIMVMNYTLSNYNNKYDVFYYINNKNVKKIILSLISLYALYLLFDMKTYLPFLG